MGIDSKNAPPLPAPTEESESTVTQTELAPSDLSKPADDKSSYSLPEDGSPVTIKTRGHKPDRSQTSLLIEYFEGGKPSTSPTSTGDRRPSVRVRLTPSKNRKTDHIQITETRSSSGRKTSLTRRQERASPLTPTPTPLKPDDALSVLSGDREDARSMHSYTSATEESNVSRNPIEVDIDRSGHQRRRRPASPLIPTADSKVSYQPSNMSDISAIPTDSFLDGSGGSRLEEKRSKSPSRARDVIGGAAAGLATAAAADKLRSKSRSELSEKERSLLSKSRERDRSERRHKSKHRKSSGSDNHSDTGKSSRKKSNKGIEEALLSGADSSVISSVMSHSHRSMDGSSMQSGVSRSSINNPKLLETVEDAIRRLILPELSAIKREQSKRESRRTSISSGTASRDDLANDRRQPGYSSKSRENLARGKDRRDREARHELIESPAPSVDHDSVDESLHEIEEVPRSNDKLKAAAAGATVGAVAAAAAKNENGPAIAREQRRRRRAEAKSRAPERFAEDQEDHSGPAPPMPLLSDANPSEITRTSILTADTDRPHSASEELAPVQQVTTGTPSIDSSRTSSPTTPTRNSVNLQALGTQHANISHGDLKTLSQKRTGGLDDDYEERAYVSQAPIRQEEPYDDEDDEDDERAYNNYYNTQDVPPPLKYVPYQPERRGLSPIPSVSGFTEGGSEIHNRDSRLTHRTSGSYSSPDKSFRYGEESPSVLSRGSYQDDRSLLSSRMDYRNTTYTDDSELDRVTSGQAVRAVGANPDLVNSPHGVESHVASLVEGSGLDESVLTGESGRTGRQYGNRGSQHVSEEEAAREPGAHHQQSFDSHRTAEEEAVSPVSERPDSSRSQQFEEYDLDEYGRKVPRSKSREAAITGAAVGAAAAAIKAAAKGKGKQPYVEETTESESDSEGGQQNKSFMERTREGYKPSETPTHSVERLVAEFEKPRVGHSGLPDLNDPMPEIGFYGHGDESRTNLSLLSDQLSATRDQWQDLEPATPTQESMHGRRQLQEQDSVPELPLDEAAGAAAVATAAAMAHSHSRQTSQDMDDEWRRTSEDRKRDTIVTNPYEGTSPLANAPGLDIDLGHAPQFDPHGYVTGYGARSPFGPKIDEGYISQGPNRTPDFQGKGIDYSQQPLMSGAMDPFYNQQDQKHMSGLSEGLESPMYDAATGTGIDRIESKDIIALMQHLMVRDAQRSARDTEILVTLVRTAAEMRNSFDDIKKMLADTEDQVITEVKDNTEKSIQRHIGGPRPYPGSTARSIQGSQAGMDNDKKTRNLWRRALKGLGTKGTNDLTRIEDMLMQLLSEVDVLKEQTSHGGPGQDSGPSLDNIQPAVQYEQDRGYEPEGHAGTSTASYASQSGHLSIPRNASGYERKVSGHRISTVPEGDEEDYHDDSNIVIHNHSTTDMLSPVQEPERGGSAPRGVSPQGPLTVQTTFSNENTPRTDKGKKHKSSGSSSWFPKISRWSETTASSVGKAFRKSKDAENSLRGGPSRSGSDLAGYEDYPVSDPYLEDFLHSGLSETSLGKAQRQDSNQLDPEMQFTLAGVSRTPIPHSPSPVQPQYPMDYASPEDPKYKAHRNSVNLQHPQPRPPQTEQYRNTLETSAQEYDAPMSPKSADFGSVTSLSRFTGHQPTFSNGSAAGEGQYTWGGRSSPAPSGPPRPPKEPLEDSVPTTTTPTRSRISNLAYKPSGSPKPENRNLQNALAVPGRRPSGPRAMGSKSPAPDEDRRRKKRDTFGTVTSQDSDTF